MSRAAPWLVAAGALLVVLGAVLVIRADRHSGGLVFLSPEEYDQLRFARRRLEVGRLVRLVGTALVGSGVGWLLVRRLPGGRLVGLVLGLAGVALVVVGAAVVASAVGSGVTVYSGSYEPAECPGGLGCATPSPLAGRAGPASALLGGLLLGSVSGRLLGSDR